MSKFEVESVDIKKSDFVVFTNQQPAHGDDFIIDSMEIKATIQIDIVSNGNMSFLLDKNKKVDEVKLLQYLQDKLKDGI